MGHARRRADPREAGGRVTGIDGGPWIPAGGHILATNGLIHDEVLGIIL